MSRIAISGAEDVAAGTRSAGKAASASSSSSSSLSPSSSVAIPLDDAQLALLADLTAKQQRNLNCLGDPNRSTRRRALIKFVKEFRAGGPGGHDGTPPKNSTERAVHAAFFVSALQPKLLALLSDDIEKCRELSHTLLTHFSVHVLGVLAAGKKKNDTPQCCAAARAALCRLFYAFLPIAEARVGSTPFAEPTEEIRLMVVELIVTLLDTTAVTGLGAGSSADSDGTGQKKKKKKGYSPEEGAAANARLTAAGPEIMAVLGRALADAFPDVKKACCAAIVSLTASAPGRLHANLQKIVVPLIANLSHQHSRVRCLTLGALGCALPCASEALGRLMQEKVLPALRSTSADRSGSVRRAVVSTAAKLCTSLPSAERYQADLLPLVLGGIADEADDVKQHAAEMMCELGGATMAAAAAAKGSPMPADPDAAGDAEEEQEVAASKEDGSKAEGKSAAEATPLSYSAAAEAARVAALLPTLGPPFDKVVPSAFAKALVQRLLPQLLKPVLGELAEWTVARRSHAAGVLSAILVFAEAEAVRFLPQIVAALGNACRDDEDAIAQRSFSCAELLGIFLPLECVLRELLPRLGESGDHAGKVISGQDRAGLLMVLSAVVGAVKQQIVLLNSAGADVSRDGSGGDEYRTTADLMRDVVATLARPVVCESEAPEVQAQLVEVMLDVIEVGCADVDTAASRTTSFALLDPASDTNLSFVRVLLQLQATPGPDDDSHSATVRAGATAALKALAEACGIGADNTSRLFERHFESLLGLALVGSSSSGGGGDGADQEPGALAAQVANVNVVKSARRAGSWTKDSPQRRLFDTLIRQALVVGSGDDEENPVAEYLHLVLPVFEAALKPACDPDLRMGMLALLATLLDDPSVGRTCRERAGYGGTMMQRLLLPNLVWRVGRVASSVRKVALRCLSTLLRRRLVEADSLAALWDGDAQLLPVMKSCLDDDEPLARQLTCLSLMSVFEILPGRINMEASLVRVLRLLVAGIVTCLPLFLSFSLSHSHSNPCAFIHPAPQSHCRRCTQSC